MILGLLLLTTMEANSEYTPSIYKELVELRQLEAAAQLQFNEAKDTLIDIKKRIKALEELFLPERQ